MKHLKVPFVIVLCAIVLRFLLLLDYGCEEEQRSGIEESNLLAIPREHISGSRSISRFGSDVDTVFWYMGEKEVGFTVYFHIGGQPGDPPDSTVSTNNLSIWGGMYRTKYETK